MKCSNCGGALEIKPGEAFSKCGYCGHMNRVRGARTLLAESLYEKAEAERSKEPAPPAEPRTPSPSLGERIAAFIRSAGSVAMILSVALVVYWGNENDWTLPDLSSLPFLNSGNEEAEALILEDDQQHRIVGVARGDTAASSLANSSCEGYLGEVADARVVTLRPGVVHFDAVGDGDLTLAVRTSDGRWLCDDDSGGELLPRIVQTLPIGVHEVWVGRFGLHGRIGFELIVSEDQPHLPRPVEAEEDKVERRARRARRRRRRASRMRAAAMNAAPMSAEPASETPMVAEPTAEPMTKPPAVL